MFGLGWFANQTLVANKELRQIKAQLEASNLALVEYQAQTTLDAAELEAIKKELDNENNPSCNNAISMCVSRGLERLQQSR